MASPSSSLTFSKALARCLTHGKSFTTTDRIKVEFCSQLCEGLKIFLLQESFPKVYFEEVVFLRPQRPHKMHTVKGDPWAQHLGEYYIPWSCVQEAWGIKSG